MNVPIWGRRKRAVVQRAECMKLIELAADASILLGIRWRVIEYSEPRDVAHLVRDLNRARSFGTTLELPQNIDFFPKLRFEVSQAKNSCLFLLLVAEALPLLQNIDLSSLSDIASIAKVDQNIIAALSNALVENGSIAV